jgi:hypothetical protein
MKTLKVAVITSCTSTKLDHEAPAEDLYRGQQQIRLMRGVKTARGQGVRVDVYIVSAWFGLVPGHLQMAPYDFTWTGRPAWEVRRGHKSLGLAAALNKVFKLSYDIVLIGLGQNYVPEGTDFDSCLGTLVRFTARPYNQGRYAEVPAGVREAKLFRCGVAALKGEMIGRVLERGVFGDALRNLGNDLSPIL